MNEHIPAEARTSRPTAGGDRVEQCGSAQPSKARERAKFEKWMRKYWGGVDLGVKHLGRDAFEYMETPAQTAWEVWQRFTGLKP